jgi:hypothetical protein
MITIPKTINRDHELNHCISLINVEGKVPSLFGEKMKNFHLAEQIDAKENNYMLKESEVKDIVVSKINQDKKIKKIKDGEVEVKLWGLYKNADETLYETTYKIQNGNVI